MKENKRQNYGFEGLKDCTDFNTNQSKKSVQSEPSVTIRESDNMQQKINQYLTPMVK
jgi:hypothetical protein